MAESEANRAIIEYMRAQLDRMDLIHGEIQRIRFRLGLLIFFLIVLPFCIGLFFGLVYGLENG